jgi:cytochrome P450
MEDVLGVPLMEDAFLAEGVQSYTALSYEAVQTVLRDGETFSSMGLRETIGQVFGHSILEMDEPEHHPYRALLQRAFSRRAMETWSVEIMQPTVERSIAAFRDRGRADLIREMLFTYPATVIAGMMALPAADLPVFHRKGADIFAMAGDFERGFAASAWFYDYFQGIIAERRARPGDDIISVLVEAELDGQRLTDDEIIAFLRLLLPAGAETTYRALGNLMFALLTHPDQCAALRADRSLMVQTIEEALRWESPVTTVPRTCTRDTEVEGTFFPAGAHVAVNVAAANRDPARWDRPEAFDIFREPKPHVAFGSGPHMCLGMHLARMETTIAVDALLDLENLRLDPDADDVHVSGLSFRSPRSLPVCFD